MFQQNFLIISDNTHVVFDNNCSALTALGNSAASSEVPHVLIETKECTKNERKEGVCVFCMIRRSNTVFFPCTHLCACNECTACMIPKVCPVCMVDCDYIKKVIIC